ncbi:MAG: hypothetical protein QXP70_06200 [Methanomassiliicoccales archaeon]
MPAKETFGIQFNPLLCTGCKKCEEACVEAHPDDIVREPRIRIRETKAGTFAANYCVQCSECAPSKVCPSDLIGFDADKKYWLLEEERCIACDACIPRCEYKAIFIDHTLGVETAYKCDMCVAAGGPRCVPACPSSALSIGIEQIGRTRGGVV